MMPQDPLVEVLPSLVDWDGAGDDLFLDVQFRIYKLPVKLDNASRQIADTLQNFVNELRKKLGD